MRVKSSGLAPRLANARPPGSAKFANTTSPGLTRRATAPLRSSPGGWEGGAGRSWNWLLHNAYGGYFEVISFLILPVFNFLILFNKKKNKQKKGSWVILCYFHACTRLTYKDGWSRTRKLNFSILARQHFAGFYFRDFNRQIWTKDIKFRDSSVLNVTLMFVKSDHPYWPVRYKDMRKPPSNRIN